MTELQVIDGGGSGAGGGSGGGSPGARIPGRPNKPSGPIPLKYTALLQRGEAVVWWGEKASIGWGTVMAVAGVGLFALAFASLLVPEMWARPTGELWQPVAVVLAPALLILLREWSGRRAIVVTDMAVIDHGPTGKPDRLGFRGVVRVRRDLWTGGVLLEGKVHRVRVPPDLAEDVRAAIGTQTRDMIRGSDEQPDDRLNWLP